MLDRLEPLGSIKAPTGTLDFGNVGETACVFMRFVGGSGASPSVVYTPEELASLLTLLRHAGKLSQTTKPGQILRLGAMRPKPIVLRLTLIHPNSGSPFVLLRLIQGRGKVDIPVPIATATELFKRGEVGHPAPPLTGPLQRNPAGNWTVQGRELLVIPSQTAGYGAMGEFLHPDEVREGEDVVVWTFSVANQEHIAAFRTAAQWRPPGSVAEPGAQEADTALFLGQTYRSRHILKSFGEKMQHRGAIDPAWAAKIALSTLLCDIADGEDESGHATWIGNSPDPVLQAGIAAIEQGQTSPHDLEIYQQVSCYFHSLGADQDSAAHAVNTILERLFSQLPEDQVQKRRLILGNWAIHLKEIYDGKPPNEVSEPWKRAKAHYRGRVVPKVICFPPPYPWVNDWAEGQQVEAVPLPPAPSSPPVGEREDESTETRIIPQEEREEVLEAVARPGAEPARRSKGKSKAPLLAAVGLLCLGGIGYAVFAPVGSAAASPTPAATVAAADPAPATPSTPAPPAAATPGVPPGPAASVSPGVAVTPQSGVVGDLTRLGKVTVGGIDPDDKLSVDRDVPGMTVLERGDDWVRLERDGFQVFMGAKQSGTRKSSRASAFASDALYSDGKVVLSKGAARDQIPPAALEKLELQRIKVVSDPDTDTIVGFTSGDFPETTIGLGQPLGADLYKAFVERDLARFRAGLTAETANLIFMDGESLFAKIAKQPSVLEYCQALAESGADVQGKVGSQALFATADPAIAKLLTGAGLDPNVIGPGGRSKLFGAGPEMTGVLLAAKANPNLQDENGATALFLAEDPETVGALIKGGANPNLADKEGRTPLMGASAEKTRALLAGGADPTVKDAGGKSASDYAGADTAVQSLLKKAKPPGKAAAPTAKPKGK